MHLFYILANKSLSARKLSHGSWFPPELTFVMPPGGFQAAAGSRSLSVTTIPNTNDTGVLLLHEDTEGNVTAFHGLNTAPDPTWAWTNISTSLWYQDSSLPYFSIPIHPLFSCSLVSNSLKVSLVNPSLTGALVVSYIKSNFSSEGASFCLQSLKSGC